MSQKKCVYCNKYIDSNLFILNYQCRKCKTIEDIEYFLSYAKLSNHFNISIEEIKDILTVDVGEHERYNEIMLELNKNNNYFILNLKIKKQ